MVRGCQPIILIRSIKKWPGERERTTHSNGVRDPGPGLPTETTLPKFRILSHAVLNTRSTPVASTAYSAPSPSVACCTSCKSVGERPSKAWVAPCERARSRRDGTRSTTMTVLTLRYRAAQTLWRAPNLEDQLSHVPIKQWLAPRRGTHAPNPTAPRPKTTTLLDSAGLSIFSTAPALFVVVVADCPPRQVLSKTAGTAVNRPEVGCALTRIGDRSREERKVRGRVPLGL